MNLRPQGPLRDIPHELPGLNPVARAHHGFGRSTNVLLQF